jgi:hypothetical protein
MKFKGTNAGMLCPLGFCITSAPAWQADNGYGTFTNFFIASTSVP